MSNVVETKIPWIGSIPSEWKIVPLVLVASENKLKNHGQNENILSLSYGKIIRRDITKNFGLIPESFDSYQVVNKGYIIIRSTDLQNDKKSLRVGLVGELGVITSAYIGLSPSENILPDYLFYYLNMCDLKKVFYSLGGGLRQSLRFEEFRRFPVILPKIEEQNRISRYLDKKTSQIDSLINKIEKKIELLKEQRTSLINQYVTKGLDPNVEMVDSGIKSIGYFPKHWKLSKYKYEITIQNGYPFESQLFNGDSGFPLIRIRDVTSGIIETFYSGEPLAEFIVKKNNLLVGMDGDFNTRWWMGPDALMNQRVCRIFEGESLDRRYISYILPIQLKVINDLTYFTTVKHLSSFDVLETKTLVPPIDEQRLIIKFLDENTAKIDKSILLESQRNLLLKEYRESLISSVVTGKVRVTEKMI